MGSGQSEEGAAVQASEGWDAPTADNRLGRPEDEAVEEDVKGRVASGVQATGTRNGGGGEALRSSRQLERCDDKDMGEGANGDKSVARKGLHATVAALERLLPSLETVKSEGPDVGGSAKRGRVDAGKYTGQRIRAEGNALPDEVGTVATGGDVGLSDGVHEVVCEDSENDFVRLVVVVSFVVGLGGCVYLGTMIRLAELWGAGMNAGT
jgi:hypothetical protein